MKRRSIISLAGGVTLGAALPVFGQTAPKVWRIVYFEPSGPGTFEGALVEFRQGMKELRWTEGRDYVIDSRVVDGFALKGNLDGPLDELFATRPDLVLTSGIRPAHRLAQKTRTVPIVAAYMNGDPVAGSLVTSLARPGANVTGLTTFASELGPKRLQLINEAVPKVAHVGLLVEPSSSAGSAAQVKLIEEAATRLGMRVTPLEWRLVADLDSAFKLGTERGVQAYLFADSPLIVLARRAISEHILRVKLPAMFGIYEGSLLSYSIAWKDNFRRAASYADRIFKGANAGELPIEQPTKFELVVNLKTARAIGVAIPQSLLLRATDVIA